MSGDTLPSGGRVGDRPGSRVEFDRREGVGVLGDFPSDLTNYSRVNRNSILCTQGVTLSLSFPSLPVSSGLVGRGGESVACGH